MTSVLSSSIVEMYEKKIKPLTSQLQSINESKLGRVAISSTSSQR